MLERGKFYKIVLTSRGAGDGGRVNFHRKSKLKITNCKIVIADRIINLTRMTTVTRTLIKVVSLHYTNTIHIHKYVYKYNTTIIKLFKVHHKE